MTREPAPAPAGAPEAAGADGGAGVDARLVRESRSGNRSARRALIDRHQDAVYNLALRMLGAPDAAADVAGETFVKAFRMLSASARFSLSVSDMAMARARISLRA